MENISLIEKIMTEFAESTGVSGSNVSPRRYLWTDAFAVCNFLELFRLSGDALWQDLALRLVEQVHSILGKHRKDDPRTGWISGLSEEEGRRHPTGGGLRIGKGLNERRPSDRFDERLEWERDGQYFHYLTKWMHALDRVSRSTGDPIYNSRAVELAKAAHAGFVRVSPSGSMRMFWKMSIDLSYPLVPSMGQHDPLDGLITYWQLQATARSLSPEGAQDLGTEITQMRELCRGRNWSTDDPLGIGSLLCDGYRVMQLITRYGLKEADLLKEALESSAQGLKEFEGNRLLTLPAEYRLPFRELGLSIGLHAVERMKKGIEEDRDGPRQEPPLQGRVEELRRYVTLGEEIEMFWLEDRNRRAQTWTQHQDINGVMLATSLAPDGYLKI